MQITTHQLAKTMLEGPDVPVAVGRYLGIYGAHVTEFRVDKDNDHLRFNSNRVKPGETKQMVFWITGSPFI